MQQTIYPHSEHQLSPNSIDSHALYVMEKLRLAGFTAYLVGGSVRDLLLGKKPKDYDISTSAEPEEIKSLFRNCILIGRRFRLAHIRFGKKILEVSTFRAGDITSEELIVRDNEWGTEEQDVVRRDFTINGLFYEPASQTIIDYVGGYPDIQRKYLRTIGQPHLRFKQDPVRMLRLLKFQARFSLIIDPETHIALLESRQEINKSSPTRILEEILRMLESGACKPFLQLLSEHGILDLLLPTLAQFLQTKEGQEIYTYLQEIDRIFQEPHLPALERPLLLTALVFPLLQSRLKDKYVHLGEIFQMANQLIDEIFHPFFHLPRKLRVSMVSIMTTQFRMTPLEKRHGRRPRIPRDPDFPLAMKFLELRSCIEPGLKNIWDEWNHAFQAIPSEEIPIRKTRVRRRRRRRPEGSS